MSAHFSFVADRAHGLIRITTSGLFAPGDVDAFLEARRAAHAELGLPPNRHMTLNDMREFKIQPQETIAVFREIMADPAYHSRRLAFVVPRTLARAQIGRAAAGRDCRCFETVEEAENWLFGEEDRAAA